VAADMILGVCSCPDNQGLSDAQARWALGQWGRNLTRDGAEEYVERFQPLGVATLDELYEVALEEGGGVLDLATANHDDPALACVGRLIADDLGEAFTFANTSRHVDQIFLGGMHYWVAGGMSWGDSPEGYEEVTKLAHTGVFDPKQVRGLLDLSTAHIPRSRLGVRPRYQLWPAKRDDQNPRYVAHRHGWMLFLGGGEALFYEEDKEAEEWLHPIIRLARYAGCKFINFDQAGDVCAWLPDYTEGSPMEQLAAAREDT